MVAIKTGDIESAKATPVERWGRLVEKWQAVTYFFPHDCRKLKQMRDECNELNMWQVLGYSSKDEFYREGLLVDPTVVELACLAIEEAPDVSGAWMTLLRLVWQSRKNKTAPSRLTLKSCGRVAILPGGISTAKMTEEPCIIYKVPQRLQQAPAQRPPSDAW